MAHRISVGLNPPFHPLAVVLLVAAYFALHLMQNHSLGPELLRFYGKDVLLVPILAAGIAISAALAGIEIGITLRKLLITAIYVTVVFEFILPYFGDQYQTDGYDVIAYALGVMVGWVLLWQNRRPSSNGMDFAHRKKSTSWAHKQ